MYIMGTELAVWFQPRIRTLYELMPIRLGCCKARTVGRPWRRLAPSSSSCCDEQTVQQELAMVCWQGGDAEGVTVFDGQRRYAGLCNLLGNVGHGGAGSASLRANA